MAIDASGLMEFFKEVTSWAYPITSWIEENPVTVGVIGSALVVFGGIVAWFIGLFKGKPKATSDSTEQLKVFVDNLTAQIDKRTAELSQANVDRGKLQQQIDELQRKLAKPEKALKEDLKRNADLGVQLDALRGRYDPNRVAAAKDAMARFDYDAAEAVFQQLRDDTVDAVKMQAAAEYGLGEIAEARVDWPAAAQHYDRAADLDPTIETLDKAGEFLWRNGQYHLAEARYNKLLPLVAAEHGVDHERYAAALNDLALVYKAQGKYDLAEATYKQAREIDRRTIGEDHPDFAIHLNNLEGVYRAQGKYDLAEATYKQALEIGRRTIGEDHPDFAIRLNNLAGLYVKTKRYAEAVPLLEQALVIFTDRLPVGHPNIKIVQDGLNTCRAALAGVE